MDYATLSILYLLCGFAYGGWLIFQQFRGGKNSQHFEKARRQYPGFDELNPWVKYVGAAIGVIMCAIVWPYSLARQLLAMRRARPRPIPLYLHPRLAELRQALRGREDEFEEILSTFDLHVVVAALHAIDIPTAVTDGLNRIARKNRERTGDNMAEWPTAADYEPASYVNIVKVAVDCIELEALNASMRHDNLRRSLDIANEITARFDHIRNPGKVIGDLIVFHVHGWAPMGRLTPLKMAYPPLLKPEFNNADHLARILSGIRVRDDRDVRTVTIKGATLTGDEHARIVREHLAGSGHQDATDE